MESLIDMMGLGFGKINCVPMCSLLVREVYGVGLMGYFGVAKTFEVLYNHFFWPHMKHFMEKIYEKLPKIFRKKFLKMEIEKKMFNFKKFCYPFLYLHIECIFFIFQFLHYLIIFF